ncbi:MAG: protease modulator HflC [Candidatus Cloacimonetes bacterium]|nr:protease modulator HflC [Candidatus Cloacimonadota bacterium]
MKARNFIIIAVIALILLTNSFYVVDERIQAIITQFGEPVGDPIQNAGLHAKMPFIQKVHFFEKRILEWDGDPKQIPTSDKRYIWVDTFARWQITDPLKFYQTTRTEPAAHSRLDDVLSGITRDVVSSNRLLEIVRTSSRKMEFTSEFEDSSEDEIRADDSIVMGRLKIEDEIFILSSPKIEQYGITLIDLKIKRINYNEDVRSKVYDRMISERNKIAAKYRSRGQGSAAEITGKMTKELDLIQSGAYKTAQQIIGEADASAIQIFANAYKQDPEFYEFLKTLETYRKTIDNKDVLIMTTDSDYFKFLKSSE